MDFCVQQKSFDWIFSLCRGHLNSFPPPPPSAAPIPNTVYSLPFCRLYHTTMAKPHQGAEKKYINSMTLFQTISGKLLWQEEYIQFCSHPVKVLLIINIRWKCFKCKSCKMGEVSGKWILINLSKGECIFTTKLMVRNFLLYFMSSTINLTLTTPLG